MLVQGFNEEQGTIKGYVLESWVRSVYDYLLGIVAGSLFSRIRSFLL